MSTRFRIICWSPLLSSHQWYSSVVFSQSHCLWRKGPLGQFLFHHSVRNFLLPRWRSCYGSFSVQCAAGCFGCWAPTGLRVLWWPVPCSLSDLESEGTEGKEGHLGGGDWLVVVDPTMVGCSVSDCWMSFGLCRSGFDCCTAFVPSPLSCSYYSSIWTCPCPSLEEV